MNHVANVFADGLIAASAQLDAKDAELARLRQALATAHALLREASNDWVPHTSNLSAAIVDALRGNADLTGDKK